MFNKDLMHFGIKGMRWGYRRTPSGSFDRTVKKNAQLKKRLAATKKASERNQDNLERQTRRLEKPSGIGAKSIDWLLQDFNYSVAKSAGKKVGASIRKSKRLKRKMEKLKAELSKNETLMKAQVKDLPKDQLKAGKILVDQLLKEE